MTATCRPISIAAVLFAAGAAAHAADGPRDAASLPITAITLYRSGVGSFERAGTIADDATVSLRFETDQINDILKSLVAFDRGGGTVRSVGFGSKEPLERRLAAFGVNLADNPSVASLLNRLRGARLRISTAEGAVEGVIMGVERRDTHDPIPVAAVGSPGSSAIVPTDFLNLVTAAGVRSVAVPRLTGFELLDAKLNSELNLALTALAERRDDRTATIDLAFTGKGARPVSIAYVQQTPVWKTSYRLVLPDDSTGAPRLQGWAIVENTTDDDWRDVRLALASGNPIGFRMDLHEPVFIERPMLPVPTMAFARPRTYESDLMAKLRVNDVVARAPSTGRLPTIAQTPQGEAIQEINRMARAAAGAGDESAPAFGRPAAPPTLAAASETGEQFRYEIRSPVTIERQRSAMLPILDGDIPGRRVSIFNPADNPQHPLRGVSIVNGSGFDLSPGPISVYDGAGYAGDAQIAYTARGQERLLTYAVDLDMIASIKTDRSTLLQHVRITNGVIWRKMLNEITTTYTLANRDQKRARNVIVEQPIKSGYEIVGPHQPSGETATVRRFETTVDPDERRDYQVIEQKTEHDSFTVTSMPLRDLIEYQRQGLTSQAVVDAVSKASDMQSMINDLTRRLEQITAEVRGIGEDQSRIRSTMSTVGQNAELYARLLKKLTEQETRLEDLDAQMKSTSAELDAARKNLEAYLKNLTIG